MPAADMLWPAASAGGTAQEPCGTPPATGGGTLPWVGGMRSLCDMCSPAGEAGCAPLPGAMGGDAPAPQAMQECWSDIRPSGQ